MWRGQTHLCKSMLTVKEPIVRVTLQPSEVVPSAKVHVICKVSFSNWKTDTDWTPDVTGDRETQCQLTLPLMHTNRYQ